MRKSGLTGDEAYALSERRGTSGGLGPLKKELSLLKEDLDNIENGIYYLTDNIIDNNKIIKGKRPYGYNGNQNINSPYINSEDWVVFGIFELE